MFSKLFKEAVYVSPKERAERVEFIKSIESLWLPIWDFRFGQLIMRILNDGDKRYFTNKEIIHLSTSEWIDMVKKSDFGIVSGEYNGFDPRKNPKRIPEIIKVIQLEWLENHLSFGEYLLERMENENPGQSSLYGYDINLVIDC